MTEIDPLRPFKFADVAKPSCGLFTDHATSNSGTPAAELLGIVRVIVTASVDDDRTAC